MQCINIWRFDWITLTDLRPLNSASTRLGKPQYAVIFVFMSGLFTLTFTDTKIEYDALNDLL